MPRFIAYINIKKSKAALFMKSQVSVQDAFLSNGGEAFDARNWTMDASSIPDQDADRRILRNALEQQSREIFHKENPRIFENWKLLQRRGYVRLEFWNAT